MNTESYRFTLGAFECAVVSDGTFAYPHPVQLLFPNAPQERLEQVLSQHNLDPRQWTEFVSSYPSLVIRTGQHQVLVDTGANGLAPTTGKLVANLQAEGIKPEDIDIVILTHCHPDHIGGVTDKDSKPAFPNARYFIRKEEWDFWIPDPDLSGSGIDEQIQQMMIEFAKNNLTPIQSQVELIGKEMEIIPGIHAVFASGHTPGHMALAVTSEGENLLCVSDAAIHPIHLEQPDWYSVFDLNPEQALASKHRLTKRAAVENLLVFAYHFPFPGLGHVTRMGKGWQWQPLQNMG